MKFSIVHFEKQAPSNNTPPTSFNFHNNSYNNQQQQQQNGNPSFSTSTHLMSSNHSTTSSGSYGSGGSGGGKKLVMTRKTEILEPLKKLDDLKQIQLSIIQQRLAASNSSSSRKSPSSSPTTTTTTTTATTSTSLPFTRTQGNLSPQPPTVGLYNSSCPSSFYNNPTNSRSTNTTTMDTNTSSLYSGNSSNLQYCSNNMSNTTSSHVPVVQVNSPPQQSPQQQPLLQQQSFQTTNSQQHYSQYSAASAPPTYFNNNNINSTSPQILVNAPSSINIPVIHPHQHRSNLQISQNQKQIPSTMNNSTPPQYHQVPVNQPFQTQNMNGTASIQFERKVVPSTIQPTYRPPTRHFENTAISMERSRDPIQSQSFSHPSTNSNMRENSAFQPTPQVLPQYSKQVISKPSKMVENSSSKKTVRSSISFNELLNNDHDYRLNH